MSRPGATRREFAIRAIGALGVASLPLAACTGEDTGGDDTGPVDGWASGGTASMSGNYAEPDWDALGSTCTIVCAMTLGPCYAQTLERRGHGRRAQTGAAAAIAASARSTSSTT